MSDYDNLPVKDLHTIFSKEELVKICHDLNLDEEGNTRQIIVRVYQDLVANGVPEEEDCTDLVNEFLLEAGFIDEDGALLEVSLFEQQVVEGELEREAHGIIVIEEGDPDNAPKCYSFADKRDPACRRCQLLQLCEQRRISKRPTCYGKMFSISAEECLVCIESSNCKIEFEQAKHAIAIALKSK